MSAVIGVDAHKKTHTCVGVDPGTGRKLGEKVVAATSPGHAQALRWARLKFGTDLLWGIEDCRAVSRRLENDLLTAGQRVVRVPTKLMARTRASARTPGKSDPIDALAVARAVLREPDLPVASHDPLSREFKLLVDRREDLIGQRTGTINRVLWRIHELEPARSPKPGALVWAKNRDGLLTWLVTEKGLVAELARDELADIAHLSITINALERRIGKRARAAVPTLLAMPGCGELTAAKLVGEAASITRFKSEDAFARYAGAAPVPDWSGSTAGRVHGTRTGNRQINTALHRIALTQLRTGAAGKTYYQRRCENGSHGKAMRCLKHHLARAVFRRIRADQLTGNVHAD
jgi:transposase